MRLKLVEDVWGSVAKVKYCGPVINHPLPLLAQAAGCTGTRLQLGRPTRDRNAQLLWGGVFRVSVGGSFPPPPPPRLCLDSSAYATHVSELPLSRLAASMLIPLFPRFLPLSHGTSVMHTEYTGLVGLGFRES